MARVKYSGLACLHSVEVMSIAAERASQEVLILPQLPTPSLNTLPLSVLNATDAFKTGIVEQKTRKISQDRLFDTRLMALCYLVEKALNKFDLTPLQLFCVH